MLADRWAGSPSISGLTFRSDNGMQVICRGQGLPSSQPAVSAETAPEVLSVWIKELNCTGSESSIMDCRHTMGDGTSSGPQVCLTLFITCVDSGWRGVLGAGQATALLLGPKCASCHPRLIKCSAIHPCSQRRLGGRRNVHPTAGAVSDAAGQLRPGAGVLHIPGTGGVDALPGWRVQRTWGVRVAR